MADAFEEAVSRMPLDELTELATKQHLKPKNWKDIRELRTLVLENHNLAVRESHEVTAKANETYKKPNDPILKAKFLFLERPGQNLEFSVNGVKWELWDGVEYNLPKSVIDHLNSLTVPNDKYLVDDKTGAILDVVKGSRNRFSVQIQMTTEQAMRLAQA
jgi:hypothetical protein